MPLKIIQTKEKGRVLQLPYRVEFQDPVNAKSVVIDEGVYVAVRGEVEVAPEKESELVSKWFVVHALDQDLVISESDYDNLINSIEELDNWQSVFEQLNTQC